MWCVLRGVGLFLVFLIGLSAPVYAEINITLGGPGNGQVFTSGDGIELNCSAEGNNYLKNISLYHDISGSFTINQTVYVGEYGNDDNTSFLCHFNNDANCEGGSIFSATSISYQNAKFYEGVMVDSPDIFGYDMDTFDRNQGTIDFWIETNTDEWLLGGPYYMVEITTKTADKNNDFEIKMGGEYIYFSIFNSSEDEHYVRQSFLGWDDAELYHIAAVWDLDSPVSGDSRMELYVNGSNASSEYSLTDQNLSLDNDNLFISVGTFKSTYNQFESVIDELRIMDVAKTESEISEMYARNLTNSSNASFVVSGISDGTYVWNCLAYDNDSESNWSSQNYTLYVDSSSSPVLNSIVLTPNSTDDVDPGITINVTANITDVSGVNTSILQYKRTGVSTWTNVTMNNITLDLWNASFGVPLPPDEWDYRIWSNDSNGNSGHSQAYNVTADYDYSWNLSYTGFGENYIYFGANESIGVMDINNTGDYPLNFEVSSSFANTFYNISSPGDFDISSGSSEQIEVNVTAPVEAGEYPVQVTVNATTANADPSEDSVNATVISYWGGPYLSVSIEEYESLVTQSATGYNYSARVRNIGNETANDTWINWTLPTGWSNASGNLSLFAGNLSNGSAAWNNITVSVGSNAVAGLNTLMVVTNSSEGYGSNASVQASVLCNSNDGVCGSGCTYLTDDDCTTGGGDGTTSGGTPTVIGGGPSGGYELKVVAPSRFDISRGEKGSFIVTVNYDLSFTADDLRLSVSGYPQTYLSITPLEYDGVNPGDMPSFNVTISAPAYIEVGEYATIITATGTGSIINAELSGSAETVIFVSSTGNESGLFEQAREAAGNMIESGLSVTAMQELLGQLESLINGSDYDSAKDVAESIISMSELAFGVNSLLEQIDAGMDQAAGYGLGTPETSKLYDIAMLAFQRGDYERAEERANNAVLSLSVETYGIIPMMMFIHSYWWVIIPTLVLAGLGFVGIRRGMSSRKLMGVMRELEQEERVINNLVLNLQKNYFIKKSVGKDAYLGSMEDYRIRMAKIRRIRDSLKAKKLRGDTLSRLRMERNDIIRFIKEAQIRYLDRGDIGRGLYNTIMKRMKEELAEVEKDIDIASKKRKGSCRILPLLLVFLLLVAPIAIAQVTSDDAEGEIAGAMQTISEMMDAGFGTSYANDTLAEANIMLGRGEYQAAASLARDVWNIRNAAFDADVLIDQAEESVYTANKEGIDTSRAREMIDEGILLFASENYVESRETLQEAIDLIERKRGEAALEQSLGSTMFSDIAALVTENWIFLASGLAGAVLVSFLVLRRRRLSKLRGKLKGLEDEVKSLDRMMKLVQERYFRINSLGKMDYEISMERYRKRAVLLEKEIMAMKQQLKA